MEVSCSLKPLTHQSGSGRCGHGHNDQGRIRAVRAVDRVRDQHRIVARKVGCGVRRYRDGQGVAGDARVIGVVRQRRAAQRPLIRQRSGADGPDAELDRLGGVSDSWHPQRRWHPSVAWRSAPGIQSGRCPPDTGSSSGLAVRDCLNTAASEMRPLKARLAVVLSPPILMSPLLLNVSASNGVAIWEAVWAAVCS